MATRTHLVSSIKCHSFYLPCGVHIEVSALADTGNILEDKRRELFKSNPAKSTNLDKNNISNHDRITLVATIDQTTFSSMTPKMQKYLHQWVDFVASLDSAKGCKPVNGHNHSGGGEVVSAWDLVFEHGHGWNTKLDSQSFNRRSQFRFNIVQTIDNDDNGPCFEVLWTV